VIQELGVVARKFRQVYGYVDSSTYLNKHVADLEQQWRELKSETDFERRLEALEDGRVLEGQRG
jgi:hypothetical protein